MPSGEHTKRMWADPGYRAKVMQALQRAHSDPANKAHKSALAKRMWADPEKRAERIKAILEANADPVRNQKISESLREYYQNPEARKYISETVKKALDNPETRQRKSKSSASMWANPEIRAKIVRGIRESCARPEVRKLKGESQRKVKGTPEFREFARKQWQERNKRIQAQLALAWRPDDWETAPMDKKIIGLMLIEHPGISNRDLGKRLDKARLIPCPKSYGKSWEYALTNPGRAANYIWEIRAWVKRPGKTPRAKTVSIHELRIS
jgi:hypothetical protein